MASPSDLYLLHPGVIEAFDEPVAKRAGRALRLFVEATHPLVDRSGIPSSLDAALALVTTDFPSIGEYMTAVESAEAHCYDRYFGIERVVGPVSIVLTFEILKSFQLLTQGLAPGTTLVPVEWSLLEGAYREMASLVLRRGIGLPGEPDGFALGKNTALRTAGTVVGVDAIHRWSVGHYGFFVLIHGLLLALRRFREALDHRQLRKSRSALSSAATLMWGAAVAMRFTGDFTRDTYDRVVRPSMDDFDRTVGFSGLMSIDHKRLVATIQQLKPALQHLSPGVASERMRFLRAYEAACDSHRFVCSRFGGDEEPSLRMMTNHSDASATQILEGLKVARCRAWYGS